MKLAIRLVNQTSVQSFMVLLKVVWPSNSVTIKSCCVLKDKLTRSVGRALSSTLSNEDHQQLAYNLPRTYQRF